MKNLSIILLTFLSININAQENSNKLFNCSRNMGGFGGLFLETNKNNNLFIGGEGAILIGNFYVGGFGYGANTGEYSPSFNTRTYDMHQSMGGIMIGAISNTNNGIAIISEVKMGWGDLNAKASLGNDIYEEYNQSFISFNPRLGLSYTTHHFLQIRLMSGYNFTDEIEMLDLENDYLEGWTLSLGFYIGSF